MKGKAVTWSALDVSDRAGLVSPVQGYSLNRDGLERGSGSWWHLRGLPRSRL